jgi:hypothetical protein
MKIFKKFIDVGYNVKLNEQFIVEDKNCVMTFKGICVLSPNGLTTVGYSVKHDCYYHKIINPEFADDSNESYYIDFDKP